MLRDISVRLVRFLFTPEELERRRQGASWDRPERRVREAPERLPLPHSFKPRLTVAEAAVAVAGTTLRILTGSLLFAVWGACSVAVWQSPHGLGPRCACLASRKRAIVFTRVRDSTYEAMSAKTTASAIGRNR